MNLKIKCPQCDQRFTVHEDLTGKTVECGGCDHRFKVEKETIQTEKKRFYPGEEKDDFLNRLSRQPMAAGDVSAPIPPTRHVDAIMPSTAGQKIAVAAGIAILLLYALIFYLGTFEGSSFQGMPLDRRYLLGGFVSLVAGILIVYGAKNWRIKALFLTMLMAGGLLALVAVRPVDMIPQDFVTDSEAELIPIEESDEEDTEEDIKSKVGYELIQKEIDRYSLETKEDGRDYVVGIFVEGMNRNEFNGVSRFFRAELKIPEDIAIGRYTRNGGRDSLVLISGVKIDFEDVVRQCEVVGRVLTYPEPRLILLELSATHFQPASDDLVEKLTAPTNPAFFNTNLTELGNLDPERIRRSVIRIANLPEGMELDNQERFVSEFIRIISKYDDTDLLNQVASALIRYAEGHQPAIAAVTREVKRRVASGSEVPATLIEYLSLNKASGIAEIVDGLWMKEPQTWLNIYRILGSQIEGRMLEHLQNSPPKLQRAAAEMLEQVGTQAALPILERYKNSSDRDLKVRVEEAISSIRIR